MLCRSKQRIVKDAAIRAHRKAPRRRLRKLSRRSPARARQVEKISQAIGRLRERYPRVARYYSLSFDPKTATLVSTLYAYKHAKA